MTNSQREAAFQCGRECLGIVFAAFTHQLLIEARQANIERLLFVARDGHLLLRLAELFSHMPAHSDSPQLSYLQISRRVVALSSTPTIGPSEIAALMRIRSEGDPVSRFANYYALPESALRNIAPNSNDPLHLLRSADGQKLVVHARATQLGVLTSYLEQESVFGTERAALVDVGWKGSIQRALNQIYHDRPGFSPLHGYYLGLWSDDPHQAVAPDELFHGLISDMRHGRGVLEGAAWHAAFIIEALCRADHGPVISLAAESNKGIVPVYGSGTASRVAEMRSESWRAPIIDGILDFARTYVASGRASTPSAEESLKDARHALVNLSFFPSSSEIEILGRLIHTETHAPNWSTPLIADQSTRPLVSPRTWLRGLQSPWRGGYIASTLGIIGSHAFKGFENISARFPPHIKESLRQLLFRIS
ncbi:MAG: hypothetical protein IPH08_06780 [Rhodocyclaceae bacterium]|nr:hypothetical protein [Rhodocyclaceae bacterium]